MTTRISDPFHAAFDPEAFRALGHQVVDLLAEHLAEAQGGASAVLPWKEPEQAMEEWPADFSEQGGADPAGIIGRVLESSHHLHHPRYVGHQCSVPLPATAWLGAVADLLNNGSAIFEMGPVAVPMERAVVQWLCARAGFDPSRADGVLTHGGSAGNLTALLAARQASAPHDVWQEGYRTAGELCLVASDQAHYSVRRSAQILGLGARGVLCVDSDARYRLRLDSLRKVLDQAQADRRVVLAVVASAGSTATGAIDPLEGIADLCAERGLWLHVDGAHAGAMVVSDRLRERLKGIERADSLVIDAHKMLLMPALVTAVLFREGGRSYETFSQQASYLFDRSARQEWFNPAHRTLECTKRMLGLPLYLALKVMGTAFFAQFQERMQALAGRFADRIEARPSWELAVRPDANIVCFRFLPGDGRDPDALQTRLRDQIIREGSFYLVKTTLGGRTWLRTTLINPLTGDGDLEALLLRLEQLAAAP
jgi:L-2,4-diaminobutyrate decarboxylase